MHHLHSLLEDTVDVVAMNGTDSDTPIPNGLAPLPEARTDADPSPTTMRFRAGTVDEAIADATAEIGREVEVIEASRIRRGGLGGFFAHDLGVEIVGNSRRQRRDACGEVGGQRLDRLGARLDVLGEEAQETVDRRVLVVLGARERHAAPIDAERDASAIIDAQRLTHRFGDGRLSLRGDRTDFFEGNGHADLQ